MSGAESTSAGTRCDKERNEDNVSIYPLACENFSNECNNETLYVEENVVVSSETENVAYIIEFPFNELVLPDNWPIDGTVISTSSPASDVVINHDHEYSNNELFQNSFQNSSYLRTSSLSDVATTSSINAPEVSSCFSSEPSCSSQCENCETSSLSDLATTSSINAPEVSSCFSSEPSCSSQCENCETSSLSHLATTSSINAPEVTDEVTGKKSKTFPADQTKWKRNIRHNNRIHGKEYINVKGDVVPAKIPKIMETCNCIYKCNEKIDATQQEKICKEFYTLSSTQQQDSYISSLVEDKPVARPRPRENTPSQKRKLRTVSKMYYLYSSEGRKERVCLKFFSLVFQCSSSVIDRIVKQRASSGIGMVQNCVHGNTGKTPANKTSNVKKDEVVNHIRKFPKVESHYCRKKTKRLYLEATLNISIMYKLYTEETEDPVSEKIYREIFHSQRPRLSFHKPKKDACSKCIHFELNKSSYTTEQLAEHAEHKKREERSMFLKNEDMKSMSSECITITFDLEAIIHLPQATNSELYYKRKLNVYNFTIYNQNAEGFCYFWNELNGSKGCNEVATCIYFYLQSLPNTVTEVRTWSDTCSSQNRNQFLMSALIYCVNTIPNLKVIHTKYLESGHTMLECDSMHSLIERKKKNRQIFVPSDLRLIFEEARSKPGPYQVKQVTHDEFLDWKSFSSKIVVNHNKDSQGETVQWLKIKEMRFEKGSSDVLFRYDYDEDYKRLPFQQLPKRRSKRKVQNSTSSTENDRNINTIPISNLQKSTNYGPIKLYAGKQPVSIGKKKDLMEMVKKEIIPAAYKSFYNDISSSKNVKDMVDVEDDEFETEEIELDIE